MGNKLRIVLKNGDKHKVDPPAYLSTMDGAGLERFAEIIKEEGAQVIVDNKLVTIKPEEIKQVTFKISRIR